MSSSSENPSNPAVNADFSKNDYYVLSSDFQGTTRLALQHSIWRQALDFNIHPSIPPLSPTAAVADVACGTGLWLIEVGRELGSSADLHAFDINLNQAPPKPWVPQNMEMHAWNVFDEVPPQFVGRFDLVHVRLITLVMKDNDPSIVIQSLCKLLKPGGHLQWDEVDVPRSFVVKAYPDIRVPGLEAWCHWMTNPKQELQNPRGALEWQIGIVDRLKANGFATAGRYDLNDKFMQHMELMRYNNDQLLMLAEQYARRVFATGHETGMKLLKTVEAAAKDAEKGAVMIMPPFCWVAKKA